MNAGNSRLRTILKDAACSVTLLTGKVATVHGHIRVTSGGDAPDSVDFNEDYSSANDYALLMTGPPPATAYEGSATPAPFPEFHLYNSVDEILDALGGLTIQERDKKPSNFTACVILIIRLQDTFGGHLAGTSYFAKVVFDPHQKKGVVVKNGMCDRQYCGNIRLSEYLPDPQPEQPKGERLPGRVEDNPDNIELFDVVTSPNFVQIDHRLTMGGRSVYVVADFLPGSNVEAGHPGLSHDWGRGFSRYVVCALPVSGSTQFPYFLARRLGTYNAGEMIAFRFGGNNLLQQVNVVGSMSLQDNPAV